MNTREKLNIWLVGASSGIGYEMAKGFAEQGHTIVISARREEKLFELTKQYPDNIITLAMDVNDASMDHQQHCLKALEGYVSHLNLFIYNAGIADYMSSQQQTYYQSCERIYKTNFFGFLNCLDIALPLIKKSPGLKHVAGVASLSAYLPLPRAEAYGSSKAALCYFLNSLRVNLYQQSINVSVINPGFVDTPMTQKNDFEMPWVWSSEKAAKFIIKKLLQQKAEIRFPRLLVLCLKIGNLLPWSVYTRLGQFMVKN